ncbi:hypothetical protein F5146DRAFT_1005958 [Armillaria mellea]|nr:hypothetical protein F5146DRAFT_1005958 [Armillaria mellea]
MSTLLGRPCSDYQTSQELAVMYHRAFNPPNADTVLSSLNGTLPSSVEERQFLSTNTMPSSNDICESLVVFPPWCIFDDLESVFRPAEIRRARGPVDSVCASITAPMFLRESLRVYAIATRFGWEEETELASNHALALSLHEEQHQEALQRISTRSLM